MSNNDQDSPSAGRREVPRKVLAEFALYVYQQTGLLYPDAVLERALRDAAAAPELPAPRVRKAPQLPPPELPPPRPRRKKWELPPALPHPEEAGA